MNKKIPAPIIAVLADNIPQLESHASLNNLFLFADAPQEPPEGSKSIKVNAWLRQINNECEYPLAILGKLIECYMELPEEPEKTLLFGTIIKNPKIEFQTKLKSILERCNLTYIQGGIISEGSSAASRNLFDLIKGRDIPSIEMEFDRALNNVNKEPREAVSAACNILESILKFILRMKI